MIIKCSKCNKDIERTSNTKNAICFDCKRIRDKKNYLKYKPEGDRRGNPELYNISWGEIRKRIASIEKEDIINRINMEFKSVSKYQII